MDVDLGRIHEVSALNDQVVDTVPTIDIEILNETAAGEIEREGVVRAAAVDIEDAAVRCVVNVPE